MRYLITIGEDEQRAIAALVGSRYELVTLEQARNGKLAEIAGQEILCWPVEDSEEMAEFAADLRLAGSLVKEILVTGASLHPDAMHEAGWDFKRLKRHLADENLLRTVINYGESQGEPSAGPAARPADSPPVSDAPGVSPSPNPPVAQALADGPAPAVPYRTGPSPEPSEFISDDLPDPADLALDSVQDVRGNAHRDADRAILAHDRQLTAAEAYRPYVEPVNPEAWPEPVNLWEGRRLPDFPDGCLPPEIDAYVRDQADRAGVDVIQPAGNCYAVCAALIRAGIGVQMQQDMGDGSRVWTEYPILWCAIVGSAGEKKKVGLEIATHRFNEIERQMRIQDADAWAKWERTAKIHEIQMAQYYRDAAKDPNVPVPELEPKPPRNRIWTDDATLESLAKLLTENPRGKVAIIKDELSNWFGSFDAFGNGRSDKDRPAYLSFYESKARPVDRVQGGAYFIESFGGGIIGGIQPDVLAKISAKLGSDGMLQRFMILISKPAVRVPQRPANKHAISQWHTVCDNLANMEMRGTPITLEPAAAAFMADQMPWIDNALASGINPALTAALSKWEGLFGRLMITSHCISDAARGSPVPSPQISLETAQQCWIWMKDVLWPHAVNFYGGMAGSVESSISVKAFGNYVLARGLSKVNAPTLAGQWTHYRHTFSGGEKIRQRREFWDTLMQLGWVRPIGGFDRTGQNSNYAINPRVHSLFAAQKVIATQQAQRFREVMPEPFLQAQRREPG